MKLKAFLFVTFFVAMFNVNTAQAQISKISFKEPLIGCGIFGAISYGLGANGQMMALSCVAGATAFHMGERYFANTIADQYEKEILQLQHQLDEFVINRAIRARKGQLDYSDYVIKETIIPSRRLDDGSIIHETIKSTLTLPGLGHRIGE